MPRAADWRGARLQRSAALVAEQHASGVDAERQVEREAGRAAKAAQMPSAADTQRCRDRAAPRHGWAASSPGPRKLQSPSTSSNTIQPENAPARRPARRRADRPSRTAATVRCRLIASVRASCSAPSRSFEALERRLLRRNSENCGAPIASTIAATTSTIISSTSVKPEVGQRPGPIRDRPPAFRARGRALFSEIRIATNYMSCRATGEHFPTIGQSDPTSGLAACL